jgi:hypothetical protein
MPFSDTNKAMPILHIQRWDFKTNILAVDVIYLRNLIEQLWTLQMLHSRVSLSVSLFPTGRVHRR